MRWENGRQGEGYQKLKVFGILGCDCYLIRFWPGYQLPMHRDEVVGKRHYRLNILLRGEDAYVGLHIFKWWRFILFRSDWMHGTLRLNEPRLLLSFGWTMNPTHPSEKD